MSKSIEAILADAAPRDPIIAVMMLAIVVGVGAGAAWLMLRRRRP